MKKVAFFSEIMIEDFDGAARTMFQLINRIDKNSRTSFLYIRPRAITIPKLSKPSGAHFTHADQ